MGALLNRYEQLLGKEPPKIPPKPPPEQPKACLSLKASISRETGFNTNVWALTQRPGDIWIGDSASTLNVAAINVTVTSDQFLTIYIDQTTDINQSDTPWNTSDTFNYRPNSTPSWTVQAINSYVRLRVENNGASVAISTIQTTLYPMIAGDTGLQGYYTDMQGYTGIQGLTGVQGFTGLQDYQGITGLIWSNDDFNNPSSAFVPSNVTITTTFTTQNAEAVQNFTANTIEPITQAALLVREAEQAFLVERISENPLYRQYQIASSPSNSQLTLATPIRGQAIETTPKILSLLYRIFGGRYFTAAMQRLGLHIYQ